MTEEKKQRLKEIRHKYQERLKGLRACDFFYEESDFPVVGLSDAEWNEYICLNRECYLEWVLDDSETENRRFEELQRLYDEWHCNGETVGNTSGDDRIGIMGLTSHDCEKRQGEMSEEEKGEYRRLFRKRKMRMWLELLCEDEDFDWEYLLRVLQFKLNRQVDYWRWFSHLANGDYIRKQMELVSRLIEIVLKKGNESGDEDTFPYYVSLRNKERFHVRHYDGIFEERQNVRAQKAYCLIFRLMEANMLKWWD